MPSLRLTGLFEDEDTLIFPARPDPLAEIETELRRMRADVDSLSREVERAVGSPIPFTRPFDDDDRPWAA